MERHVSTLEEVDVTRLQVLRDLNFGRVPLRVVYCRWRFCSEFPLARFAAVSVFAGVASGDIRTDKQ